MKGAVLGSQADMFCRASFGSLVIFQFPFKVNLFPLRMTTLCGRQAVVDENAFIELADQVL